MSSRFWALTPRDTNPIEGSHAQDNQVNKTNATLLEAILGARQFDSENAARQSRSRQKKAEANLYPPTKCLRALLKAAEKVSKDKDSEIQRLHAAKDQRREKRYNNEPKFNSHW
ncbi:hypothetical protein B0H13DRAFT_1851066 [Mycena leptocephala]|nr:hypothetical protein B0H13DRAFT_1851066 [Mycena leptocephala]